MIISGFDLETTGLSAPQGHRIIEVALAMYQYDGVAWPPRKMGKTWTQRINPKREIDPKAQAVHGISWAELQKEPVWEKVAPMVAKLLNHTDLLIAHNMNFDGPFVGHELMRVGIDVPSMELLCTMEKGRPCMPTGKVPSLKKLCWAMDVEYDPNKAHAADYDVDVMMEAFFRGVQRGLFALPVLPVRSVA